MATTDKKDKDKEKLRAYKFRLDPNQAQTGRDAMMRVSPTQILKKNLMRLPKKINAISS